MWPVETLYCKRTIKMITLTYNFMSITLIMFITRQVFYIQAAGVDHDIKIFVQIIKIRI